MKRRLGRSTNLRRLALIFTLLAVVLVAYALGWSSLFTVKNVVVLGVPVKNETQMIRDSVHIGEKMARLEPRTVTNSLRKFSWFDHADLSRNWLKGTVTIRVWARTPVAGYEGRLIDSKGVIFDLPGTDTSHLPLVTAPGTSLAKLAIDLFTQLPEEMRDAVEGVSVQGPHSVTMTLRKTFDSPNKTLDKTITLIWGDLTDTALKVKVYQALLALPENSEVSTINVSAPHAPIVK